jgi:superfamily II DNA or RNA helicase
MVREGYLQIRVLVPRNLDGRGGIFHSKVGILTDSEGNQISFSGSVNETAAAWRHNIEEFKVFKSWEPESAQWVRHDQEQFERYWAPSDEVPYESRPLPDKIRERLVDVAPENLESLDLTDEIFEEVEEASSLPSLRPYQEEAVYAWINAGMRGILEMATGTGKTRTAFDCIQRFQESSPRTLTVVTAPFQHIAVQWREILAPLRPVSTFDSGSWRKSFTNSLNELKTYQRDHLVWISVQNTASSPAFLDLLASAQKSVGSSLFVGDEAHGLGARVFRQALAPSYVARLGLSATPTRWFDELGSAVLFDFFGESVFEFNLSDALTWVDPATGETPLTPYEYHPEFVDLSPEELEEFVELTAQIRLEIARHGTDDPSEKLELLLFKRAAVVKTAQAKLEGLRVLLDEIDSWAGTLIYCHNETQMAQVIDLVSARKLRYRRFTGSEGATPRVEFSGLSEREWILKSFEEGEVEVLVAMKCLDEGVDVPSAKRGIILASSGNPREFIQRRGRLLRRHPGKDRAVIHDFVVFPPFGGVHQTEDKAAAGTIIAKELARIAEFSQDAMNSEIIRTRVLDKLLEMGFQE